MAAANKPNELRLVRLYDAPVKLVWDAWTVPAKVATWWGPRGFTLTTHSRELKPGGHWDYTMHGPDGTDYHNKTLYHEVEKHAKLVYDHGGSDDRPALFRVTVLFSESNGKTKMDMTMTLPTAEAAEEIRKFIKSAGGDATWDRLAEFLEKESSGKEKFVINRSFNAPQDLLFKMWTDPKFFSQWLPPTGFTMQFVRVGSKPGGSSFYYMTNGSTKMYGKIEYVAIEKPNRIVYKQQFSDEHEQVSRHPMSPTWPETMLTIVEFAGEGAGHTRVTVTWEPYGATAGEIDTFVQAKGRMTQGWTGSMDKLEHILEKREAA